MEAANKKKLFCNYEFTKGTRTRSKVKFNACKGGHVRDEQPYWEREKFDQFHRNSGKHQHSTLQVRCGLPAHYKCDVTYSIYSESACYC